MDSSSGMRQFLAYHHRMLMVMALVSALVWLGLRWYFPAESGLWYGYLAGALVQLIKFGFLDVAVVRKIAVEQKNPAATQLKTSAVTLVLFAGAAFLVVRSGWSVWAMAAGIFLPRLILIADTYIRPNPFGTSSGQPDLNAGESEPNDGTAENLNNDASLDVTDDIKEDDGSSGRTSWDRPPLEERRDS